MAGSAKFASAMTGEQRPTLAKLRTLGSYALVNNTPAGGLFGFAMPAPDNLVLTKLPIEYYKARR